jgi:CcmD family protein
MNSIKKISFSLFFSLITLLAAAQEKKEAEMADLMRSNGRIYVVVTVVLIILIGLFLYIFRLDKKISKLEKEK